MELYRRENYLQRIRGFYDAEDIIKVITGVRRCGKSCLMQTIAEELEERGVPAENLIWMDLDRREFRSVRTAEQLEERILQLGSAEGRKYLFLDEVQNVKNFEETVNGFRAEGGWSIFLAGSNACLLSGEMITKLTGRYLQFEIFPLTFDEYTGMKRFYGLSGSADPSPVTEFTRFLREGGFPGTVFLESQEERQTWIEGLVREIFEKDIRSRVKIRERATFEAVQNWMFHSCGTMTSISSLCSDLQANGIRITRNTLSRYLRILADARILYPCDRFDMKSKRSLSGERKYYLSDLSFCFAGSTDQRISYGAALENLVYIYARAHRYSVSVGRIGNTECDFILRGGTSQYAYVQVSATIALSEETEDREYRPLEKIRDNYPKYVASLDSLLQKRNGIVHVNLADFMQRGELF